MQALNANGKCTRCGGPLLTDGSTGEQFCQKCGNVVVECIEDYRPERRSFSDDSVDKSRTGTPNLLAIHDRGLSTTIGTESRDATGKSLSTLMKQNMRRLRIWDSRSQTHESAGRNLRVAFIELDKLKDKLTLSDSITEKAAYIYRKAVGKGLVRGRSIPEVLGAAAYAACRDTGIPRTLNDVSVALNIKKKSISKSYRMLVKELDLKMPVADSIICISKIASKINLDEKAKRHALEILRDASDMEITAGKGPMGLAAAAIYISCLKYNIKISQREISVASGVTEVTIRNRSHGLSKSLTL
nr:transcription initiation factor IIB [Candidatus Nitrosotenuis uzonensis]